MGFGKGIKRSPADAAFSDLIREVAGWKCEMCGADKSEDRRNLHLSHYFSRRFRAVRFDVDNVSALCVSCHRKVGEDPYQHTKFFEGLLGQRRLEMLAEKAYSRVKVTAEEEKKIAKHYKLELEEWKENPDDHLIESWQ